MKKFYLSILKTMLALFMVITPVLFYGQNAKMWRQYNKVDVISSEPTLTVKGGMVEVSFEITVPGGYFSKNAAMFVQPELRFKGGKTALQPLTLKGEEVTGDGVTINHKEGGSYTYTDNLKYDAKYNRSELYVVSTVYMGKDGTIASIEEIKDNPKSYECCHRMVANGVIYTGQRMLKKLKYAEGGIDYEPVEVLNPKNAVVYFAVNKFDINWDLRLNIAANTEERFNELTNFSKEGWKVKSISIDGWASPEGITVNDKLSENRANAVYDEVIKTFDQLLAEGGNFSFSDPANDIEYLFSFRGSDWDGFMRDLASSDIAEKDAIAKSINDAGDEAAQDRALRRAMNRYAGVRGLLAPLRRTELAINYVEPYKTKAEIAEAAMSNPGSLELKELLYAAANADNDAHKLAIYKTVFEKYPKCWISKNNAAVIYMKEGEFDKAGELLNEAIEMYPDQETLNANLGALAIHHGDYAKAEEYFAKAGEVDAYNKGMIALAKGDYDKAAELLTGACDYNAGLAQLMSGDYQKAEATLSCTEEAPCQAAYLVAVIGARTGDANKVFTNLKKAFEINPALKKQAMYDREFENYRNAAQFKELVY